MVARIVEIDDWPDNADACLSVLDDLRATFPGFRANLFAVPDRMKRQPWREVWRRPWLRCYIHGLKHRRHELTRRPAWETARLIGRKIRRGFFGPAFKACCFEPVQAPHLATLRSVDAAYCVHRWADVADDAPDGLKVWSDDSCYRVHASHTSGPRGFALRAEKLSRRWSTDDKFLFIEDATTAFPVKVNLGGGEQQMPGWHCLDPRGPVRWRWGEPLPFPDSSVSAMMISHSLMYCAKDDWLANLRDCRRAMRSGAVLRISEDETRNRIWRPAGGFNKPTGRILSEPTVDNVRNVLETAGFWVRLSEPGETESAHKDILKGDSRHRRWRWAQKFYMEARK
jgi:predicted SAM-dependent methyltransferase